MKVLKAKRDIIDDAWEQSIRLFAPSKAMRPHVNWFTGVSIDTAPNRVQRLMDHPRAAAFRDIINRLDAAALQSFIQRGEINLERAAAALRLNLVVNISVPIGALVIINQVFPATLSEVAAVYGMDAIILAGASVLFVLLLAIWYSYCCVTQARDLVHLTRLYAVGQVDTVAASPDGYEGEPVNPADLV